MLMIKGIIQDKGTMGSTTAVKLVALCGILTAIISIMVLIFPTKGSVSDYVLMTN